MSTKGWRSSLCLGWVLVLVVVVVLEPVLPTAAQSSEYQVVDEMTLVQITNIPNTGEQTFQDALLSGSGRVVVYGAPGGYDSDRTLYLANSDGIGSPLAFDTSVGDPEIKGLRLLDVSYDGNKILYFKQDRYRECSAWLLEHDASSCGYYLYDADTQTSARVTPCYSDPRVGTKVCLWPSSGSLVALSGDGRHVFLISGERWQCTLQPSAYGRTPAWQWSCDIPGGTHRLYRVCTAELANPQVVDVWGESLESVLPAGGRLYSYDPLRVDYAGETTAILLTISGESGGTLPESGIYFNGGDGWYRLSTPTVVNLNYVFDLNAEGNWVAYNPPYSGGTYYIQHASGNPQYANPVSASLGYHTLSGITQDGQHVLFEDGLVHAYALWIAGRDGAFDPVTAIAPGPACDTAALSYDGQTIACPMDQNDVGNHQYFVVHGQANPDLSVDPFTLAPATAAYSAGRYVLPVDVTVRNTGRAPAVDFQVQLRDRGGWSDTRTIASLAADASTVLHLDWDLTDLLTAGKGQATVQLTVATDPTDQINEISNLNNATQSSAEVDARPRLTQVRTGYRPGTFLAGVSLPGNFDTWVDWNGDLSGTGATADDPDSVTYELNGAATVHNVNNPAGAPAASQAYNLGSDLQAGANVLRIWAKNGAGFESESHTLTLQRADNAAWLGAAVVTAEAEPPGATYDKIAIYKAAFEWPNETLSGYFDVPANKVNLLKKEYGPKIDSWSLGLEFRSDGAGAIKGSGEFEGEVKGKVAVKATITASGAVRAAEQLRLTKLEGSLRGEGEMSTPRVPLSPWLPFLYAQAKIGAGADATLGVYEQASGKLAWSPLVLGLDVTAEGTLSSGVEGVAYVEGGVGGQPRGEFNLPPDPSLLKSLTIRLYAWGKAQFLIWEKGYEAEYEYVAAGPGGQSVYAHAPEPRSTGWRLREAPAGLQAPNATGPLAMDYAYADPALAIAADDTVTLAWVDDQADQLEIRASRWDGATWSATAGLTDDGFLDAHPDVAYDGAGNAVALWARVPDDTPPADPHDALAAMEIMAA
ncbi:MAG: hypothetical protein JXC32_05795, partial [Anaerolineae bacterium]|nr:hypothetical protein [Anaerolineae bacterium]